MHRWFIAYKYVASRMITLAALLAVTFSVAVLIIVVSVMEGFRNGLEQRIRGSTSDIKVESDMFIGLKNPKDIESHLREIPGIRATAPVVETFALYRPQGVFGAQQDALDHILLAMDLENDLSREEFQKSLDGLPDRLNTKHRVSSERDEILAQSLLATQPRTIDGLFSPEWLDDKIWEPWRKAYDIDHSKLALRPIVVGIEAFRNESLLPGKVIRLTSFSPDVREPIEDEFLIAGFFKTGLYEIDAKGIIIRMEDAEGFLKLRDEAGDLSVSGIRIAVDEGHESPEALVALREKIETKLAEENVLFVETQTWREARAQLLNAVKVEKVIVSIILGAVILFAGFMIFIILTVQVVDKSKDIGVLQSLGATTRSIAAIYFTIGASLCLLGTILGTAYGIAIACSINGIQRWVKLLTGLEIFPDDVYYLDRIPVKFRPDDLAYIILATLATSLLASLLPAIRAARRNPTEGLRSG